jgi:hypothetical protein
VSLTTHEADDAECFRLYEAAVQSPEVEIALFERVYTERYGRAPLSLREDFCGTALLCRHWVESDPERIARGVDRDASVITRAHTMNRKPLDEDEAERLELTTADARDRSDRTFDVITAGNFSWALFDASELYAYIDSARDCLEPQGLLALELFGGADLRRPLVHEHRHDGFTYVWEQTRYDAESKSLDASIHFALDDGRKRRNAFRYTFRIRGWNETRAVLESAGFREVTLWVEKESGGFVLADDEPDRSAWSGYVMGFS